MYRNPCDPKRCWKKRGRQKVSIEVLFSLQTCVHLNFFQKKNDRDRTLQDKKTTMG